MLYYDRVMDVYFDNAATTMVREEAIDAMVDAMRTEFGNPSSTHYMGRRAAAALEKARSHLAGALAAKPDEIYFTSGGTESDNWAVLGSAQMLSRRGRHMITSSIEHDAVTKAFKKLENAGWEVTYIDPDSKGRVPIDAFAAALREDTVFASIIYVNNETGAINPIGEYSQVLKRRRLGTLLHTDAVQGFCKVPTSAKALGAQLITVSAHKIHGPKGVGALYIENGIKLPPMQLGGSQEMGKRAGTEALPAIAGFGEATRLAGHEMDESKLKAEELHLHTVRLLSEELPQAVIISEGGSPYILSVSLPGYKSEVLMSFLEAEGICVSKGAACKKGARSHVLEAMRLKDNVIDGALRISFSRYNTLKEAEYLVEKLKEASINIKKPR